MTEVTLGQQWTALKKEAWRGYKIAKAMKDENKMKDYANKIRSLQHEIGIKEAEFPEIGICTNKIEVLKTQMKDLQMSIDNLKKTIAQAKEDIETLESRKSKIEAELSQVKSV